MSSGLWTSEVLWATVVQNGGCPGRALPQESPASKGRKAAAPWLSLAGSSFNLLDLREVKQHRVQCPLTQLRFADLIVLPPEFRACTEAEAREMVQCRKAAHDAARHFPARQLEQFRQKYMMLMKEVLEAGLVARDKLLGTPHR